MPRGRNYQSKIRAEEQGSVLITLAVSWGREMCHLTGPRTSVKQHHEADSPKLPKVVFKCHFAHISSSTVWYSFRVLVTINTLTSLALLQSHFWLWDEWVISKPALVTALTSWDHQHQQAAFKNANQTQAASDFVLIGSTQDLVFLSWSPFIEFIYLPKSSSIKTELTSGL